MQITMNPKAIVMKRAASSLGRGWIVSKLESSSKERGRLPRLSCLPQSPQTLLAHGDCDIVSSYFGISETYGGQNSVDTALTESMAVKALVLTNPLSRAGRYRIAACSMVSIIHVDSEIAINETPTQ